MAGVDPKKLVRAASRARKGACAPYSGFRVGAALVSDQGKIFTGANVESASYGLTCCAERIALFKALNSGARFFKAVAISAATPRGPMPCGACRQLLAEYAPKAAVYVHETGREKFRRFTVSELIPHAFITFAAPEARPPART